MKKLLVMTIRGLMLAYLLQVPMYGGEQEVHKHDKKGESCFICDSKLREKGRLWCKEHDRYEDRCWICHPELEDEKRMWCKEHSLYEDECFLCHPEAAKKNSGKSEAGEVCKAHKAKKDLCFVCDPKLREKGRLWCKEHARYEDRCWLCHPEIEDKDRAYCKEHYLYEDECLICNSEGAEKKTGKSKAGPLCKAHKISTDACFVCDPKLREKGRLWCKEHARYEDRCWLCHPEIEDKDRAYCKEHYLYEDECIFCNPDAGSKGKKDRASTHDSAPALFCNEHQVAEIECGICQPQLAAELEPGQSMKVRMSSDESADKAGVISEYPKEIDYKPSVAAYFEVQYNQNAYAQITPLAAGIIKEVLADVGQDLSAGDPMAIIHSAEISDAKAGYLTALVDLDIKEKAFLREQKLSKEKISALKNYQAAEADYKKSLLAKNTARQKILNYGFTDSDLNEIADTGDSSAQMPVRAPFDGTVVYRHAVMGEAVQEGSHLFSLAGLDKMWLDISVPAENTSILVPGLEVRAVFDDFNDQGVSGKIDWVNSSIDERSRMVKARAVVPNPGKSLKAGMFGRAEIAVGNNGKALAVPRDAIQYYENKPYLFVQEEADLYALRRVSVAQDRGDTAAVLNGLKSSERIVVARSFTMMSEFLKSRLGAGCVDD